MIKCNRKEEVVGCCLPPSPPSSLRLSQFLLLASTMLVFLLLHCLICHPPVLYSTDAQNILKEMDCLSSSFLIERRMSYTLKGWIWTSDRALLVYVEDELKGCMPRGYLEHMLHHTIFMCAVQRVRRTVTLDAMRTTCNLEYGDKVLHLVTDDPSDWLYQVNESQGFLARYMNSYFMSSTQNMQ